MSLRCVFIVCLGSNKVLFYNSFRTVETRWVKQHPEYSKLTFPEDDDLVQSLLNELGILNPSSFQFTRDSCKKNFHAPLFWVPYTHSPSHFWPVLIVECKNRLLCGVPFLENIHPFEDIPSLAANRCAEIAIVLEVLQSLVYCTELPATQLDKELKSKILQHLPFGRPIHHWNPPVGLQTTPSKTSLWPKSKPKLEIKVTEEVKLAAYGDTKACEVNGTAIFNAESDSNSRELRLQLIFQKIKDFPEILFHSCASPEYEKDALKVKIKYMPDKTFTLLHYNFKLSAPPIEATLKIRNIDERRRSIKIQLHASADVMKFVGLNRLEVRMPIPGENRISHLTLYNSNPIGSVSLIRDGTLLSWNVISQTSPNSSSLTFAKVKDLSLNAEIEVDKPNISLQNSFVTVLFSANGTTLSDLKFTLYQSVDFKLSQSSTLRSGLHYRTWNDEAEETI